jgi:hypothetical protein
MGPDPFSLIPPVRRARGYRLYAGSGGRLLDLYQDGGRAILGRRPEGVCREIKSLASRGLAGDLPSAYGGRLITALRRLLPAMRSFRLASSQPRALWLASLYLGRRIGEEEPCDPALVPAGSAGREISLWRPFLPAECEPSADVLLPVLPFGAAGAPAAVCFRGELPAGFPPSDTVSPLLLAACARALYNLSGRVEPPWTGNAADPRLWDRRGPYLAALCGEEEYGERYRAGLARGVLLCPRFPGPSILPAEASDGEVAAMRKVLGAAWRNDG